MSLNCASTLKYVKSSRWSWKKKKKTLTCSSVCPFSPSPCVSISCMSPSRIFTIEMNIVCTLAINIICHAYNGKPLTNNPLDNKNISSKWAEITTNSSWHLWIAMKCDLFSSIPTKNVHCVYLSPSLPIQIFPLANIELNLFSIFTCASMICLRVIIMSFYFFLYIIYYRNW